jgi:uncharacterized membrane protein
MSEQAHADFRTERMIGVLLRAGVLTAATVVIIGGVLYLFGHCHDRMHIKNFHGETESLRTLTGIVSGALHGNARAIIQLGLILLVATPVARVMFSAVAFAVERDRLYVGLTMVVLAVLVYSLFAPGFQ